MRIKWVNPSQSVQAIKSDPNKSIEDYITHVNLSYYNLRSYYKYKSEEYYNKLEWDPPHFYYITNEDIERIAQEKLDILCLSFFIWNSSHLFKLAKRAKELNPDIKIIAGGIDLDAHKRLEFFNDYPYIDYVAYGDGEEPFALALDSCINKTPIPETAVNLVTKDRIYPHKVFSDKKFWAFSYILDMKDEIKNDCNYIRKNVSGDLKLYWELDRGCPYACSFCDWSSGLHHKVKRRSKFWKEEFEFFKTLPVSIGLANANFGIYEEDVEIAEYIRDSGVQEFKINYFAKMNKDRVWKIKDILAQSNKNYTVTVSIQDVDEEILNNIDRPAISWEEEKEYILNFNKIYPEIPFYFEIIIGLPGQTLETFKYLLLELDNLNIRYTYVSNYIWYLLNNSPAYDKDYQEKFKMTFEEFFIPTISLSNEYNEDITFDELKRLYDIGSVFPGKVKLVKETYSADVVELLRIIVMMGLFSGIKNSNMKIDFSEIIFKPSFDRFLTEEAKTILESIEKNKLFGRWCQIENKWLPIDTYYHREISVHRFLKSMGYK